MTKDKTVTMSRELALIDRELLVIANVCVMRIHDLLVEQLKAADHKDEYRAEISRLKNTHTQLITALAAPILERQDYILIKGMYFSHAEILQWREDACTPAPEAEEPITIEAVGVTREGQDGIYIEWTLEGGIAALETAGLVLFACPEANDMCEEDGSAEIYLKPVDLDATEQRGFIRGMNAESEARDIRSTSTMACDMPPPGWSCSRTKGHDGPCAASQVPAQPKQENFTYSSTQATNCAGCGKHKHTPLRVDAMGGYVCLTCIDKELDRLLIEESAREAEGDWSGCQEISDLPRVHEVMSNFSTYPTEDNGIAVVQAIVQATTRKSAE